MSVYIPTGRTVTIASGGTTSGVLILTGAVLLGVQLPAAFTGTAVSFQVSADNVTFTPLCDSTGATVSVTTAANKAFSLDPALTYGWRYVKIVSNAAEGGDRVLTTVSRVLL